MRVVVGKQIELIEVGDTNFAATNFGEFFEKNLPK